jgi:hypothetical protein
MGRGALVGCGRRTTKDLGCLMGRKAEMDYCAGRPEKWKEVRSSRWASREHGPNWDGPRKENIIVFTIFWFKEMGSKSKVLNISKPNLNWIQNRIKWNQLFWKLFKSEKLEIV